MMGNLGVTVVAALLGGPAAIVGVFLAGGQGWFQMLYVVVFGYLSAAIVLHGLYNLAASLWIEDWLR